jgi:hypothetical protein
VRVEITCCMTVSGRINFDEPIPQMIERLKSEHVIFETKLVQIEDSIKRNEIKCGAEIIQSISNKVISHAVEEEARLMRVIMHKAKNESSESIKIMQEHNWVMEFLKSNILLLERAEFNTSSLSPGSDDFKEAKKNMNEFVTNLRNHFWEEEQIVFPLVVRLEEQDLI